MNRKQVISLSGHAAKPEIHEFKRVIDFVETLQFKAVYTG